MKHRPAYAIGSVDHALCLATWLQQEGSITASEAALRLGVGRSTAHQLLTMLVYRDFAVQDECGRAYRPGPVLDRSGDSPSGTAVLRAAAVEPLGGLVDLVGETANLAVRTHDTARFIASVECTQTLRVAAREGMVFPAHRLSCGLVLLAELSEEEVRAGYETPTIDGLEAGAPDLTRLVADLGHIRRRGLAICQEQAEHGVVAIGRAVRDREGRAVAGLSIAMPSVRYSEADLPRLDAALRFASGAITAALPA